MAETQRNRTPAVERENDEQHTTYLIRKRQRTRWWEVVDPAGQLVCLTVYKRGAKEVVRRLEG